MIVEVAAVHQVQHKAQLVRRVEGVRHAHDEWTVGLHSRTKNKTKTHQHESDFSSDRKDSADRSTKWTKLIPVPDALNDILNILPHLIHPLLLAQ